MNIYQDTIAECLGMQSLPQNILQEIYNVEPELSVDSTWGLSWKRGMTHTDETKQLLSEMAIANQKDGGHRLGMPSPMKGKNHTKQTKQKISNILSGKPKSAAHRGKMAIAALNRKRVECPKCGTEVPINLAKRWHFDNCKN